MGQIKLVGQLAMEVPHAQVGVPKAHVRAGITAGRSQEEIVKVESLKGFEDFPTAGGFLSLANTLTAVHAELAGK